MCRSLRSREHTPSSITPPYLCACHSWQPVGVPSWRGVWCLTLDVLLVRTAGSQIFPSDDPLDDPKFDTVDYINSLFPNEQVICVTVVIAYCLTAYWHTATCAPSLFGDRAASWLFTPLRHYATTPLRHYATTLWLWLCLLPRRPDCVCACVCVCVCVCFARSH